MNEREKKIEKHSMPYLGGRSKKELEYTIRITGEREKKREERERERRGEKERRERERMT